MKGDYYPKYDAGEHWNRILEELESGGWIDEDAVRRHQLVVPMARRLKPERMNGER